MESFELTKDIQSEEVKQSKELFDNQEFQRPFPQRQTQTIKKKQYADKLPEKVLQINFRFGDQDKNQIQQISNLSLNDNLPSDQSVLDKQDANSSNQPQNLQKDNNSEDDCDYYAETEKPEVQVNNQQINKKYETIKSDNISESTADNEQSNVIELTDKSPQSLEEIQEQYIIHEQKGQKLLTLKNLTEIYQKEYEGTQDCQLYRCVTFQTIKDAIQGQTEQSVQELTDEELYEYLKQNSRLYKNVINIKELARGGEAIVYRLEHQGLDEVVLKMTKQKPKNSEDPFLKQYSYFDIVSESQQLKLLQSEQYIAKVKEEIIEFDHDQKLIQRYSVVVKRARFSLMDLLKIWKNPQLQDKYVEYFTHEKLAYYFYQAMQILAYLHQRNVYYGDMKPHNLLVFKNQLVKVGDLGISQKLRDDLNPDQKAYKLKGISWAYASIPMHKAYQGSWFLSKKQLFEGDKFSLIRTFQQCMEETKHLKVDSPFKDLPQQMIDDLMKSDLIEVIRKYEAIFAESINFAFTLIQQMFLESKHESLINISLLTKYKCIIESQFVEMIYRNSKQVDAYERVKQQLRVKKLDQLHDIYDESKYDKPKYIVNNDGEQAYDEEYKEKMFNNMEFKHLLQILTESIREIRDHENLPLIKTIIYHIYFEPYYEIFDKENKSFEIDGSGVCHIKDLEKARSYILSHEQHLIQYFKWVEATCYSDFLMMKMENFLTNLNISEQESMTVTLLIERCYHQMFVSDEDFQIVNKEQLNTFKFDMPDKHFQNKFRAFAIKYMLNQENDQEEAFKWIELSQIQGKYKDTDFHRDNWPLIAMAYLETLLKVENYDLCQSEAQGWLEGFLGQSGESNEYALRIFGILGTCLITLNLQDQDSEQFLRGLSYMTKYSKQSLESYLKTLYFFENNNLLTESLLSKFMPPSHTPIHVSSDVFECMIKCVFLKKLDSEVTFEGKQESDSLSITGYQKLIEQFNKDSPTRYWFVQASQINELFQVYMRYFKGIMEGDLDYNYVLPTGSQKLDFSKKVRLLYQVLGERITSLN
eukprot:403371716